MVSTDEIGAVAEGFNRMLHGLRERELVKETFGKYVTPEIRDEILAGRISGEGELKEVTVLFADIRDFTPWVEATAPRDVVRDLNEYFTEMAEAIRAHRGLVLQFIGDEIEAVFGAPIASRDHAAMAVRAALDMRERLRAWNARREAAGKPALRHGIGIHTGTVLAGNIGGAERLSYALVGDPVNLASRIQGLTKDFKVDILISEATRKSLDPPCPSRSCPRFASRAAPRKSTSTRWCETLSSWAPPGTRRRGSPSASWASATCSGPSCRSSISASSTPAPRSFRGGDPRVGFSLVAFGALIFVGYRISRRWAAPLTSWSGPEGLPDATIAMVRRRRCSSPTCWRASRSWAGCWPACSGASSGRSWPAPWRSTASSARSSATR